MKKLSAFLRVIFLLVISFAGMVFYESCCGEPEFAFFEIQSMEVFIENPQVAVNDTLKMYMIGQQYKYLNAVSSPFSKAYAWQCLSNGHMGSKYRYTELAIICDKAVDDLHPAGTNLNDLFLLMPYQQKPFSLDKVMNIDSVAQLVATRAIQFGMPARPSANSELEFLIFFKNSNNQEITVKTPLIRWN